MADKGFNLAEALSGVSKMDTGAERIELLDIAKLGDDPRNFYQLSDLDNLAENIELVGLQQPLRVRPNPDAPGHYIIVSGHRRRAAIQKLVDDGRDDLRHIPCIVEQPCQSEAMQELRLIFANSGTRKLSDPEIAAQADRVQELLYRLKEEGVEFPGRMRDHVAEACQVSKSKLARLKVIQDGLTGEYLEDWQRGKLNESAAYALARMHPAFREHIRKVARGKTPDGNTLETLIKRFTAGDRLLPEMVELTCPDGKPCTHCDGFLRHAMERSWDKSCNGTVCCLDCPDGAKRNSYACEQMCSKAKTARKKRHEQDREKADKAEKKRISAIQRASLPFIRRVVRAADDAGLPDSEPLCWDYNGAIQMGVIRQWERGDFSEGWPSYYSVMFKPADLRHPLEAAKTLRCSADYLLGLTDELHPAAPAGYVVGGHPAKNTRARVLLDYDMDRPFPLDAEWDGSQWWAAGTTLTEKVLAWYPYPPMPTMAELRGETEGGVNPEIVKAAPCYTGFSPYGYCGAAACCGSEHRCCSQCDVDCNLRCGWIPEEDKHE